MILTLEKYTLKTASQDTYDKKEDIIFYNHILTKSYGFIVAYCVDYVAYCVDYVPYCAICSDSYILDYCLGSLNNSFVSYLT